jgi:hypothetical protein
MGNTLAWSDQSIMTHRIAYFLITLPSAKIAHAWSIEVELLNNIMPVSGTMAGTNLASPQESQSAVRAIRA